MLDLELVLFENKSVASAITSDAIDFGQEKPNTGSYTDPMYVVVNFPTAGTGAGDANSVVFNIQDCDTKEGDFATVASTGKIAGEDLKGNVVIPMPVRHRQFVKVTTTVTGTITGNATAYITNAPDLPMEYKKVGIDILPTVD